MADILVSFSSSIAFVAPDELLMQLSHSCLSRKMIRFRDKTFEQWSICPATGDIFDVKTGEVQPVRLSGGRPCFKKMTIHQIMVHTFFGYKLGYDVHHKDENPLNNTLSNLVYLTHSEHARLHSGELLHDETRAKLAAALKGKPKSAETKVKISEGLKGKKRKPLSEETRLKISEATKGKIAWNKGRHHSAETIAKISQAIKAKNKGKKRI